MKVTDLRTISTQHAQRVLCIKLDSPGDIPPLFLEMFDEGGTNRQEYQNHPNNRPNNPPSDEVTRIASVKAAAIVGGCIDTEGLIQFPKNLEAGTSVPVKLKGQPQTTLHCSPLPSVNVKVKEEVVDSSQSEESKKISPVRRNGMHSGMPQMTMSAMTHKDNLFPTMPGTNCIPRNGKRFDMPPNETPFKCMPPHQLPSNRSNMLRQNNLLYSDLHSASTLYGIPEFQQLSDQDILSNGMHVVSSPSLTPPSHGRPLTSSSSYISPHNRTSGDVLSNGYMVNTPTLSNTPTLPASNALLLSPDHSNFSPISGVSPLSPKRHLDYSPESSQLVMQHISSRTLHSSATTIDMKQPSNITMDPNKVKVAKHLKYSNYSMNNFTEALCDTKPPPFKNGHVIPPTETKLEAERKAYENRKEYFKMDGDTAAILDSFASRPPELPIQADTSIASPPKESPPQALPSKGSPLKASPPKPLLMKPEPLLDFDNDDISSTYVNKKLSHRYRNHNRTKSTPSKRNNIYQNVTSSQPSPTDQRR